MNNFTRNNCYQRFNYDVLQIQYDKQCGDDNICDTGLTMQINPITTRSGYIISGETRRLEVKVDLGNAGENAYNIILDMQIYGNLSTEGLRTNDIGKIQNLN